jgi:Flp pilus assembly pilin Flp
MARPPLEETAAYRRPDSDRGASAAEYALLASFIAVAVIGAVTALGMAVQALFVFPAGL